MKFRKLLPVLAGFAAICFASCQKEVSKLTTDSILGTVSNYIDKWYILYSDDTSDFYTFSYDFKRSLTMVDLLKIADVKKESPVRNCILKVCFFCYLKRDPSVFKF